MSDKIKYSSVVDDITKKGYALYSTVYHMLFFTTNDCLASYR